MDRRLEMTDERLLRILVFTDVGLALAAIGAEASLPSFLLDALRAHAINPAIPQTEPGVGVALWVFWALAAATTIVAWIGLLFYWPVARPLYLAAWGLQIGRMLVSGPSVTTPLGGAFDTLDALVGGALIGLVYFSGLSRRFAPQSSIS
jgi:hypothetical protein